MRWLLTRWPLRLFGIFIPLGNVDILNGPFRPPVWVIENFYFDTHYVGLVLKFAKISPKFSQNFAPNYIHAISRGANSNFLRAVFTPLLKSIFNPTSGLIATFEFIQNIL